MLENGGYLFLSFNLFTMTEVTDGFGHLIYFIPTDMNTAIAMYKLLDLKRGQVVYDLGCGNGSLLCPAEEFGLRGVGFEINHRLAEAASYHARVDNHPVKIINDDFGRKKYWRHLCDGHPGEVQIADADGILLYLIADAMKQLAPRLRKELRPGTRIVSNDFKFPDSWKPAKVVNMGSVGRNNVLYLYEA